MGVRRKKTAKWIPNELVERAKRVGEKKGMTDNDVIRLALRIGLEFLEKERDIFEEIDRIKREVELLKGMGVEVRKEVDPFIERLVEGI